MGYQTGFKDIYINPLIQYYKDIGTRDQFKKDTRSDTLVNLQNKKDEDIKNLKKRIEELQNKLFSINEIGSLVGGVYATNIEENKNQIVTDIAELQRELAKATGIESKINNYLTNPNTNIPEYRDPTDDFKKNNLFEQIIQFSKLFKDDTDLNEYNTRPFLKILEKISKDPKYYNNTFFFHNLVSNIICQFIERFYKLFDKKEHPYLSREKLIPYKETLTKLVTLMKDTMGNKIIFKNEQKRHINKNDEIKSEYKRICFTIDMVVGNAFIKVLRRLILSFLRNIILH